MIGVIDYGVGNVSAFLSLCRRVGVEAFRANSPTSINEASHLILPGVGHFDHAMQKLNSSSLRPALEESVLKREKPILGVCVGMQMLATTSEEGVMSGLNWIPGQVVSFTENDAVYGFPIPHMGWNTVNILGQSPLFSSHCEEIPEFYFLHSFHYVCDDSANISSVSSYGIEFQSSVSYRHIHGVQFHPEKSHRWGGQLIRDFVKS